MTKAPQISAEETRVFVNAFVEHFVELSRIALALERIATVLEQGLGPLWKPLPPIIPPGGSYDVTNWDVKP